MSNDITYMIYDIEVLPNVFTMVIMNGVKDKAMVIEVSPWVNGIERFRATMDKMAENKDKTRMVGFNSYFYDYPVIHFLYHLPTLKSAKDFTTAAYQKSKQVINTPFNDKYDNVIWDDQAVVPQIDLFKVHHFDNKAKSCSLKKLEFNMRMNSVVEFETDFDSVVRRKKVVENLIKYNIHDVDATKRFFLYSIPQIKFREAKVEEFGVKVLNWNDTKVGENILLKRITDQTDFELFKEHRNEDDPYDMRVVKERVQTKRTTFPIKDILFEEVGNYRVPEFQEVYEQFKKMHIFLINGSFHWNEHLEYPKKLVEIAKLEENLKRLRSKKDKDKLLISELNSEIAELKDIYNSLDVSCEVGGVEIVFGRGGLHASGNFTIHKSENGRVIRDIDVKSLYPSIAIENEMKPAHLPKEFINIYAGMRSERFTYEKGTPENKGLKLGLNGAYGKSSSVYSSLYDPLYTMQTTINGQLLLALLWDRLYTCIEGIELIQINTDGITYVVNEKLLDKCKQIETKWEEFTKLKLEDATYTAMFTRDVNNYIAVYDSGKVKLKGAYNYTELHSSSGDGDGVAWHKDHSAIVIKKAAVEHLVNGTDIKSFISTHDDIYDFCLCTNVNRKSSLMWGNEEVQRNTRYIVAKNGHEFTKIMPPLPKNPGKERPIAIQKGYLVQPCNDIRSARFCDLNYSYYIDETKKLVKNF